MLMWDGVPTLFSVVITRPIMVMAMAPTSPVPLRRLITTAMSSVCSFYWNEDYMYYASDVKGMKQFLTIMSGTKMDVGMGGNKKAQRRRWA